jgi:hypothetical protein
MNYPLRVASLILLGLMGSGAQCFSQVESTDFPRYTQAQGGLDGDGFPVSGAKLCLLQQKDVCFRMPAHTLESPASVTYDFGLDPRSERLTLRNGGSWVFFSATFSAGGSGTLERIAVLRYERDGSIKNLMPYVAVTDVSQRAMWNLPDVSPFPVFVDADFIWGKDEPHFGDHFYRVEAWRYDPAQNQYVKAIEYKTAQRYDGGDAGPVRVLPKERDELLRRLARGQQQP